MSYSKHILDFAREIRFQLAHPHADSRAQNRSLEILLSSLGEYCKIQTEGKKAPKLVWDPKKKNIIAKNKHGEELLNAYDFGKVIWGKGDDTLWI